jgi:hypothetical protein
MTTEQRRAREALLDEMLADSFPASDAPSFTPVTGVGGGESAASHHASTGDSASTHPARDNPPAPADLPDAHLAAGPA